MIPVSARPACLRPALLHHADLLAQEKVDPNAGTGSTGCVGPRGSARNNDTMLG